MTAVNRPPATVGIGATMAEALAALDPATGTATLADADGADVGVLTDAHIRRALNRGARPEDPVAALVATIAAEPPVAQAGPPATTAVPMVGGRGERLRPYTDKVPKPLLTVGGTTILGRMLGHLAAAGLTDVRLTVNYKAEAFEERIGDGSAYGVEVTYVREDEPLGTAGGLRLLDPRPVGPFVVLNGDLITSLPFPRMIDFHRAEGAALTVATYEHSIAIPYGVVRVTGSRLVGIDEKPTVHHRCNAGIYVLEPDLIDEIPVGQPLLMTELIDSVMASGRVVAAFPIVESYFDIGSPDELERVLHHFLTEPEE